MMMMIMYVDTCFFIQVSVYHYYYKYKYIYVIVWVYIYQYACVCMQVESIFLSWKLCYLLHVKIVLVTLRYQQLVFICFEMQVWLTRTQHYIGSRSENLENYCLELSSGASSFPSCHLWSAKRFLSKLSPVWKSRRLDPWESLLLSTRLQVWWRRSLERHVPLSCHAGGQQLVSTLRDVRRHGTDQRPLCPRSADRCAESSLRCHPPCGWVPG